MNVAILCLGGNIGNRTENINASKEAIDSLCGKIIAQSSIYETEAWGSDSERKYLNQVIKIETKLTANQLLSNLLKIEKKLGRKRDKNINSDRTIDIDILFFNSEVINNKTLEIPHPRLHQRNFVLKPLNEIASDFKHPVFKKTISVLHKNNKDTLKVKKHKPIKECNYICIEGNIGSGKSTLAKALAKNIKGLYLPEEFDDNALLPLFYENKKLFAFPLEYSFLINRFKQIQKVVKNKEKFIVSDYSLYKCLWFAKINLSKKDFLVFKKQFKLILKHLPKPDLIIHLTTNTKNLEQNIKKRGRKYEKSISSAYLNAISREYIVGIDKIKNIKKLNLNISNYHPKLESISIKKINNFIKENFGY